MSDLTDERVAYFADPKRGGGHGYDILAREVQALRRWKAEATTVIEQWESVWESAGSPGALGQFKADALGDYLVDLQEELGMANAYIADVCNLIADLRILVANALSPFCSHTHREQLLDEMRFRLDNHGGNL